MIKNTHNLTFLVSGLSKGGTERVVSILASQLSKKNFKVNVISTRKTECAYEFDKNVNIEFINCKEILNDGRFRKNPLAIINSLIKLILKIKKHKTDTLISFGESSNLYAILAKFFCGIKTIVCKRQNPLFLSKFIRFLIIVFYRFADLLIVQTDHQAEWAKNYFKLLPISKINNPIMFKKNQHHYNIKQKSIDFLSVGTIKSEKKYEDSILAFNKIKNKISLDSKYFIAGRYFTEENRDSIERIINKHNLQKRVILLGNVDDTESLFKKSKIYIISSISEGQPNSLLEAMSYSIPSISSSWPGINNINPSGLNLITYKIGDIDELSRLMLKLYNDNELKYLIGQNGYDYCKNHFDQKLIIELWIDKINLIHN